ncbi:MAG TPA: prephenate dehydrogenase/arogenate dehydrogenase family protein [Chitinispirillaceae bacterium]|nr:prephenate dehydrogenase/arogenate dehydrogenase family protein [Chitinispirillaceae bacterium]
MFTNTQSIGIYSAGLLGASIGLSLKANGFTGTITGFSSPSGLTTALNSGAIDRGFSYEQLEEQVSELDILFLCSPINTIINTIHKLSKCSLKNGCIITDVGSTKRNIMKAAELLPAHVTFIGGHPMAGSEKSGPSAALPDLFKNAMYALTPAPSVPLDNLYRFSSFLKTGLCCRTIVLSADVHDSIVAATSHIPHILAVMLVNHVRKMENRIPSTYTMTAGSFRDMTRIASTPFPIWKDIFETNGDEVRMQIDDCIAALQDIKNRLHDNTIGELFDAAKETRSQIASITGGIVNGSDNAVIKQDERN